MLRRVVDSFNSFATFVKKSRWQRRPQGCVKINLGSGLSVAPGWIHIDGSPNALFAKWPVFFLKVLYRASGAKKWYSQEEYIRILKSYIFLHHNLDYGIPFQNESIDYIYSSHWLEHLFLEDAQRMMKECYRVLKPGGVIRICVPNLQHAVQQYLAGKKEEALKFFFSTSRAGALARHQYLYDEELLGKLLEEAKFVEIMRRAYREGLTPDIDELDNRLEETLYMEAKK